MKKSIREFSAEDHFRTKFATERHLVVRRLRKRNEKEEKIESKRMSKMYFLGIAFFLAYLVLCTIFAHLTK